jgi:hypothetical protein
MLCPYDAPPRIDKNEEKKGDLEDTRVQGAEALAVTRKDQVMMGEDTFAGSPPHPREGEEAIQVTHLDVRLVMSHGLLH